MFKNIKYQIKRAKQTMLFQCLSLQNNIVDSRIPRKSKGLKSENAEISRLYRGGLGEFPHVSVKVPPAALRRGTPPCHSKSGICKDNATNMHI